MVPVSYADVLRKEAYIYTYNRESTRKKRTLFNSTPPSKKKKKKKKKTQTKKTKKKPRTQNMQYRLTIPLQSY